MGVYSEIRERATPSTEMRHKVDACEAVTKDLIRQSMNAYQQMAIMMQYVKGTVSISYMPMTMLTPYLALLLSHVPVNTESTILTANRTDAAAELATKEAQCKTQQEEREQKEKIRIMEEYHRKELEIQKSEFESLQVERDMVHSPSWRAPPLKSLKN